MHCVRFVRAAMLLAEPVGSSIQYEMSQRCAWNQTDWMLVETSMALSMGTNTTMNICDLSMFVHKYLYCGGLTLV